jgi:hypothetical protein
MGAAISTASNTSNISNNTSINSTQNCSAASTLDVVNESLTFGLVECKQVNIGGVSDKQTANCNLSTNISAFSKAIADQAASSTAAAQNLSGAGVISSADTSNVVNVQNQIAMAMQSNCGASQNTKVRNKSFSVGTIRSLGACSIAGTDVDQSFACVDDISAQASADASTNQTAKSSAQDGSNFATFLIVIIILVAIFFFCGGPELLAGLFGGSAKKGAAPRGYGPPPFPPGFAPVPPPRPVYPGTPPPGFAPSPPPGFAPPLPPPRAYPPSPAAVQPYGSPAYGQPLQQPPQSTYGAPRPLQPNVGASNIPAPAGVAPGGALPFQQPQPPQTAQLGNLGGVVPAQQLSDAAGQAEQFAQAAARAAQLAANFAESAALAGTQQVVANSFTPASGVS